MERLQRVIAARGVSSRRSAEELITSGRVSVNGQTVTELGTRVNATADEIRVDGKVLRPQRLRTVLLNKPAGYITTMQDERERRTVMELVPTRERLYPVGRLDRDTEGLLLLTNDGELANRIMHPRYRLAKEYHVLTTSRPPEHIFQRVREGVRIDNRLVVPDEIRLLRETREGVWIRLDIHEGVYHAVRRLMESVNIPVVRLRRHRIGPVSVQGVEPGAFRDLSVGELAQLGEAVHLGRDVEPGHNDEVPPSAVRPAPDRRRPTFAAPRTPDRPRDRPAASQRWSGTAPARGQTHSNDERPAPRSASGRPARDRPTIAAHGPVPGRADRKTTGRTGSSRAGAASSRRHGSSPQAPASDVSQRASSTPGGSSDPNGLETVGGRAVGPVTRAYRSQRSTASSGEAQRPGQRRSPNGTPARPERRPNWARRETGPAAPSRKRRDSEREPNDRTPRGTPIETVGRTRRRNQPGAPPAAEQTKRRSSPHSHSHRGRKPHNRGTTRGRR